MHTPHISLHLATIRCCMARLILIILIVYSGIDFRPRIAPKRAESSLQIRSHPARPGVPLAFVENIGQADPQVRFQALGMGGTLFFTLVKVVFSLPLVSEQKEAPTGPSHPAPRLSTSTSLYLHFEGADPGVVITGNQKLPGVINSYTGNDPAKWQTNIPSYQEIVYWGLYPGIDLYFNGETGSLKGTFQLAPGADPEDIRWCYQGAAEVRLDPENGDLVIGLPVPENGGDGNSPASLVEHAPVAWQEIGGQRIPILVDYRLGKDGCVSL